MSTAAQTIKPYLYWSFDNDTLKDVSGNVLNVVRHKMKVNSVPGKAGRGLAWGSSGIALTQALRNKVTSAVTIEFCFKGKEFQFQTFATPHFMIRLAYPYLRIINTTSTNAGNKKDDWVVRLNGSGKNSYDYYVDGKWHHLAFVIDVKKGIKQIFVDGENPPDFNRQIEKGNHLVFDGMDGFRLAAQIDELAFYNAALPASYIAYHYDNLLKGKNYSFSVPAGFQNAVREKKAVAGVDPREFAPGYPDYTIQATEQLRSFPDPRYKVGQPMKRNFPWLDISYLHRELPGNGGKGFGKLSPDKAVEILEEMIRRWNYYLELPCLRVDSAVARKRYANPGSIEYSLINFARKNPQIPIASVIMQIQGRPVHAGLGKPRAFENAQDLPDNYYLKDATGKIIVASGKKWLSPLAPLDIIRNDAYTTVFYLKQLTSHLGRPIDFLNDNGELFGHMRPESLLKQDPRVKKDMEQKNWTNAQYNGWFQNHLDTTYKNTILRTLGWKKTLFTFYNVSAYNAEYWPDYSMRRTSNFSIGNNHYSTPSFYPVRPNNWRSASGPNNGYGSVAQGRFKEIALGDKLFAPFVSAGWSFEELNVRPAQWLALLKSMVMLGADFFHVGYFNVTGGGGKWPNGTGPFDPRGYIYQVAMPAYAQAIASRVYRQIADGTLLNPTGKTDKIYPFRFEGNKENQLILVRKLGRQYLIYGSVQPNSNMPGNVKMEEPATISLEGKEVTFNIRRQGSMYMLDLSNGAPVFYQLDGWHQYEHPYYWKKNIRVEAENADDLPSATKFKTSTTKPFDFTNFTTWIALNSGQWAAFSCYTKPHRLYECKVRVRNNGNKEGLVRISGSGSVVKKVTSSNWAEIVLSKAEVEKIFIKPGKITIKAEEGDIDLDWVEF